MHSFAIMARFIHEKKPNIETEFSKHQWIITKQ